ITEMQDFYGGRSAFRVGVGTLCRRASSEKIASIIQAIREVLPYTSLHLWGIKLTILKSLCIEGIRSTDSAVWNGRLYRGNQIKQQAEEVGISMRKYITLIKLPQ